MAEPSAKKPTIPSTTTIHSLPETILINEILTKIHTRDAVCFSISSPKFRNLHRSIPTLHFSISNFTFYGDPSTTLESFADFINQTLFLRRRSVPLQKFKLIFHLTRRTRYRNLIQTWLRSAFLSGTKKITFNFAVDLNDQLSLSDDDDEEDVDKNSVPVLFHFHFSDYRNSLVEKLTFCRCELTVLPFVDGFKCLRSLKLVDLNITDDAITALFYGCKCIESFSLLNFRGPTNIKICSDNLKKLDMRLFIAADFMNSSLEIVAPRLEDITLSNVGVWKFRLDDSCSDSLVDCFLRVFKLDYVLWGNYLGSLTGVKRLTLKQNFFYKFWITASHRHLVFNNLVHLEINTAFTENDLLGLALLLQSSPNIRTMVIHVDKTDDNKEGLPEYFMTRPLLLNIPSLKRIEIRNSMVGDSEIGFISLLKLQKVVLDTVVIVPAKVGEISLPTVVLDWSRVPPNVINWSGGKSCDGQSEANVIASDGSQLE